MTGTFQFYFRRKLIYGVVIWLAALIPFAAISQNFTYRHYDEKDGLPSAVVYSITQDREGFIWFGTENGLCRFDGKQFKTYTTRNGLPDNEILRVFASKSGKLYFSAFTHPLSYLENDSIHSLKIAAGEEALVATPGNIFQHGDKLILSVEGKYSYMLFPNDSVIPVSRLYPGLPREIAIFSASDSMFTCGTNGNIYFVHTRRGILRSLRDSSTMAFLDTNLYHLPKDDYTSFVSNSPNRNNLIYTLTRHYAYLLDGNHGGKMLQQIPILKSTAIFTDSENNTWVATSGAGVYRFPSFDFRQVKFPAPVNEVFSIIRHKGKLLAGNNYSTIHEIIFKDTTKITKTNNYSSYLRTSWNTTSLAAATNRVLRLFPKGDTLYMVCDAFILQIDPNNKVRFNKVFPGKDIDAVGDRLLVCTGTTAVVMDARTFSVIDTILNQRTTTGVIHHNSYYIGTLGGLLKIDISTGQQTLFGSLYPALKKRIVSIRKGWNDDLWIATSGIGVINLKDDKIVRIFDSRSGLASDICTSLYIDSTTVWVGTNSGLSRIRLDNDSAKVMLFSTTNGLASNFINTIYVDENTAYVGSSDGFTYFNKHQSGVKSICVLQITGVSQGNQPLRIDSSYTFSHDALNIMVNFTAISFKSAGNNTYYYKLEGLDPAWNTTSNTFINFPTLPAGEYTLLIRAVNQFGVESETKRIYIVITPPWWQTWWFISIAGIFFATGVFFIYRRNISAIKKRELVKRNNEARLAALEQQALQSQMNPHFIFNCLNSIQSFILDFDAEGANQYLTAFASMIRQTLDLSSHPLISVADEIRYLDTYLKLEKLRFREKFNYRIQIAEKIDTFDTWIPGMLLQPFIENALRHGIQHRPDNDGIVVLDIKQNEDNGIVCIISDNGVGRKRAREIKSTRHIEYQSKGTFISQKRVNAINSQFNTTIRIVTEDIIDDDGNAGGTVVKIIIPELRKTSI